MIGMILGNRYELLKEIGSGGMANVYLARCRVLNRNVAVKVLKPEFANDKEFLSRFNKEAQAAGAINSANIVNVHDVGHDGDTHYIVMEYVEGCTLKEYIDKNGKLSWQQTVEYAIQICSALDKAHKNGIIHRDIKPQNIILTNDGVLKVTDFGIARASTNETVNMSESTMGSVHYFSPEQAKGAYTDEKSDLYSLGIVMYELVTGQLPFNGDTPISIAIQHMQKQPVSPKEYNIAVPLAVEAIILKAMAKEKSNRYGSAEEMLADLYACRKNPDEIPEEPVFETADTNTIKYTPIGELDIEIPKEEEEIPTVVTSGHREVNKGKKKKPAKKPEQGSAKKAVLLAILTAFGVLAIVAVLGLSILGGCSKEIQVPNLVGELYEDVIEEYKDADFTITIEQYVDNAEYEAGTIVSQSPKGGRTTKSLKEIKVKVAKDSKSFVMSDFEGYSVEEMKKELSKEIKAYELTFEEIEEDNTEVEKDKITRTYPPKGSKIEKGTKITVYISKGGVEVPDLLGTKLSVALDLIERAGLSIGNITPSEADDDYVVIDQSIQPEESVEEGTKIDISMRKADGAAGEVQPEVSKVITVVVPQDKDVTTVRVVQDGTVIHNQAHTKSEGSVDITIKGNGSVKIDIYYDGNYKDTMTVTL